MLGKLRRRLRLFWYRRNYYWSRVRPSPVPFNPLPYLPSGFTVRQVGETDLRIIDNFITRAEADYLLEQAREQAAGAAPADAVLFDQDKQDERLLPVIVRGAMLAGVPPEHVDRVSVHHGGADTAGPGSAPDTPAERVCTVLVYLNDAAADHATRFSDLQLAVQPVAGRAVCWGNRGPGRAAYAADTWVLELGFLPAPAHTGLRELPPLQARPGQPLTERDALAEGAWLAEHPRSS